MRSKEDLKPLLAKCIEIQKRINEKIPLATNRFEQFEQINRTEIETYIKAKIAEAQNNHEEPLESCIYEMEYLELHDKKYELYQKFVDQKKIQYQILNEINLLFSDFLTEANVTSAQQLSPEQNNTFKNLVLKKSQIFCDKLTRTHQLLGYGSSIDEQQIDAYLQNNIEHFIEILSQGEKLNIDDEELAYRFKKDLELGEHRDAFSRNFSRENVLLVKKMVDPKIGETIEKKAIFAKAEYFDKEEIDVGFCDEHTSIALKRLYDEFLIKEGITVEAISVSYFDDNGQPADNHIFLAINRDPDSPLNDMSQWKAILFDPWNKVTCFTDDLNAQPYFISYPAGAQWESIKFTEADYDIKRNLNDAATYFSMTGSNAEEKRVPQLIEEHQLTSLDKEGLEATKSFLYKLLDKVRPDNFKGPIEIFITSRGAHLVDTLSGFSEPKIIIHSDFLKKMQNGVYTVEELEFALANALLYIMHEGVGIYHSIPSSEQHKLDRLSIEKCHNAPAAISYLRKSIDFEAQNQHDISEVKLPDLIFNYREGPPADFSTRIKSLMTLLAIDEKERDDKEQTSLPGFILDEVASIKRRFHFNEVYNVCEGTVEVLNYLKSKLNELITTELLPYELTFKPSIQVRDFCQLLHKLPIDFENPEHLMAANQLIDRAYELKVPAFELIYLALVHQTYNKHGYLNRDVFVRPLGFFNEIEQTIQAFISAQDYKEAKEAAEKLKALREKHTNHLSEYLANSAFTHLYQFKKDNRRAPTGRERFFGSSIGAHIKWSNFRKNMLQEGDEVPWSKHLNWAKEDDSHVIADTLWSFGINNDKRLWSLFEPKELYGYTDFEKSSRYLKLPEAYKKYANPNFYENILNFLSEEQLQTFNIRLEMFFSELSFEEQFKQFYDLNWAVLIHPGDDRNSDNIAIRFLLAEFANIALNGTSEEKAIVKSFFLGREDNRDLEHLIKPNSKSIHSSLSYKSCYVPFVTKQEFQGAKFNLFTPDEQIKIINDRSILIYEIPAQDLIHIFRLPFESLSIECITQLMPLIEKSIPWYADLFKKMVFLAHIEEHGPYSILSKEAVKLIQLVTKSLRNPADTKKILTQFKQDIPQDINETRHLTPEELVFLYRTLDAHLLFLSTEVQERFAALIIQRISEITDDEERMKVLETLLFVENNITLPLSNIQLRNEAIKLLVNTLGTKYGKDNQSSQYKEQMIAVINHLFENVAQRDAPIILSRLADTIESQWGVTEHLGILLEPEKYLATNNKKFLDRTLSNLAVVSQLLSEDKNDIVAYLDFISAPITNETTDKFTTYLLGHEKINNLAESLGYGKDIKEFEQRHPGSVAMMLRTLYCQFWDRKLEERAVIIDHLLIPANAVKTAKEMDAAYEEAFLYVTQKLFPNIETDEDEAFAFVLLKAYLETANQYIRSHLLAGMLVATNEVNRSGEKPSAGKKLALLCEHMGPAYIKLAQAVHSHPRTPEHIRRDLDHVKGRANPPPRWQLWRLIREVVSHEDQSDISRIGALLGSASYNLALEAELKDGQHVVLLMQRENAAKDAEQGFAHLEATIKACTHKKMESMRETVLSIIKEAEALSTVEMDKDLSEKQNQIASQKYNRLVTVMGDGVMRTLTMKPAHLLKNGQGYRFIERFYGIEFNELPNLTKEDKATRKAIAKAVITVELVNILSGGCFDSDRHGNQLRYEHDKLGLYDFGEMSLAPPTEVELRQLGDVLRSVPKTAIKNALFGTSFDTLLSEHIEKARKAGEPTTYLMRVRKAFLALRDFQKELSNEELFGILKSVNTSGLIHPKLQTQFSNCIRNLGYLNELYRDSKSAANGVSFFAKKISSLRGHSLEPPLINNEGLPAPAR
ncbi:AarF/UbiB family protein [Legionella sp. WA2022007384]